MLRAAGLGPEEMERAMGMMAVSVNFGRGQVSERALGRVLEKPMLARMQAVNGVERMAQEERKEATNVSGQI